MKSSSSSGRPTRKADPGPKAVRQPIVGKRKRGERNGRKVFATEPVAYPLRPLRPPRFPLFQGICVIFCGAAAGSAESQRQTRVRTRAARQTSRRGSTHPQQCSQSARSREAAPSRGRSRISRHAAASLLLAARRSEAFKPQVERQRRILFLVVRDRAPHQTDARALPLARRNHLQRIRIGQRSHRLVALFK